MKLAKRRNDGRQAGLRPFSDERSVERQPFSPNSVNKAPRIRGATEVTSVCPYCAVGCSQKVYVKGGKIIDIEGNEALRGRTGRGFDREPGADMTQRLGARSGRLVRPRRGHHVSTGFREQRLRCDYGRVADICGCSKEEFLRVAETLCENSGRERTSAFVYAVGWTQRTTGVQMIRAAGILQLLLGNMGRPGAGIMATRGHASIQGSTDVPTLYELLPGYIPQPASIRNHGSLKDYLEQERVPN